MRQIKLASSMSHLCNLRQRDGSHSEKQNHMQEEAEEVKVDQMWVEDCEVPAHEAEEGKTERESKN